MGGKVAGEPKAGRAATLNFNQVLRDVVRDLDGFLNGLPVGDQTLEGIGRRQPDAFRQSLEVEGNNSFHGHSLKVAHRVPGDSLRSKRQTGCKPSQPVAADKSLTGAYHQKDFGRGRSKWLLCRLWTVRERPEQMRVTSVELHQNLGRTIDRARVEPVTVAKHDRDHVVILSAEEYGRLRQAARQARLTGSLTTEERAIAAAATVPSKAGRRRFMARLVEAVETEGAERSVT